MAQQEVVIVAKKYGAWWRFKTTFKWGFIILFPLVFWWLHFTGSR
jgi:hypothetical protein